MAFPRKLVRIAVLLGLAGGGDGAVAVDAELRSPTVRPGIMVMLPGEPGSTPEIDVAALASEAPSRIVDAVVPPIADPAAAFDEEAGYEPGYEAGYAAGYEAAIAAPAQDADQPKPEELSLVELRAAAMLVSRGTVERVTLAGFRVWPGLMAESTEISRAAGVRIVPAVARTGGQVDFIVTRDEAVVG